MPASKFQLDARAAELREQVLRTFAREKNTRQEKSVMFKQPPPKTPVTATPDDIANLISEISGAGARSGKSDVDPGAKLVMGNRTSKEVTAAPLTMCPDSQRGAPVNADGRHIQPSTLSSIRHESAVATTDDQTKAKVKVKQAKTSTNLKQQPSNKTPSAPATPSATAANQGTDKVPGPLDLKAARDSGNQNQEQNGQQKPANLPQRPFEAKLPQRPSEAKLPKRLSEAKLPQRPAEAKHPVSNEKCDSNKNVVAKTNQVNDPKVVATKSGGSSAAARAKQALKLKDIDAPQPNSQSECELSALMDVEVDKRAVTCTAHPKAIVNEAESREVQNEEIKNREDKNGEVENGQVVHAVPKNEAKPGEEGISSGLAKLLETDHELRDWLKYTGYHDPTYRARFLDRRRKMAALKAQQDKLMEEELLDQGIKPHSGANSAILPGVLSTSKPADTKRSSISSVSSTPTGLSRAKTSACAVPAKRERDDENEEGDRFSKLPRVSDASRDQLFAESGQQKDRPFSNHALRPNPSYDPPSQDTFSRRESRCSPPLYESNYRRSPPQYNREPSPSFRSQEDREFRQPDNFSEPRTYDSYRDNRSRGSYQSSSNSRGRRYGASKPPRLDLGGRRG